MLYSWGRTRRPPGLIHRSFGRDVMKNNFNELFPAARNSDFLVGPWSPVCVAVRFGRPEVVL